MHFSHIPVVWPYVSGLNEILLLYKKTPLLLHQQPFFVFIPNAYYARAQHKQLLDATPLCIQEEHLPLSFGSATLFNVTLEHFLTYQPKTEATNKRTTDTPHQSYLILSTLYWRQAESTTSKHRKESSNVYVTVTFADGVSTLKSHRSLLRTPLAQQRPCLLRFI